MASCLGHPWARWHNAFGVGGPCHPTSCSSCPNPAALYPVLLLGAASRHGLCQSTFAVHVATSASGDGSESRSCPPPKSSCVWDWSAFSAFTCFTGIGAGSWPLRRGRGIRPGGRAMASIPASSVRHWDRPARDIGKRCGQRAALTRVPVDWRWRGRQFPAWDTSEPGRLLK